MNERYNLNDISYKKKDEIIETSIKEKAFSLETVFGMIKDLDGPRAMLKLEELISDESHDFKSLRVAFEKVHRSLSEDLQRRAVISLIKRPDCSKDFIQKYGNDLKNGLSSRKLY